MAFAPTLRRASTATMSGTGVQSMVIGLVASSAAALSNSVGSARSLNWAIFFTQMISRLTAITKKIARRKRRWGIRFEKRAAAIPNSKASPPLAR